MARLLPFRPERPDVERAPKLVDLEDGTADEVFAALSSEMARSILSRLYEEPTTASEVADAVDTSLQNARYHLDKLVDAGLVEEVDTWYSSRGTEMTVYGPTSEPLILAAGREESTGMLRDVVSRVLGAVAILGLASLLVDRLARLSTFGIGAPSGERDDGDGVGGNGGDGAGGNGGDGAGTFQSDSPDTGQDGGGLAESTGTPPNDPEIREFQTEALADGGLDALATLPPGALFFAGGLMTVALVAGWWYVFRYRRYHA